MNSLTWPDRLFAVRTDARLAGAKERDRVRRLRDIAGQLTADHIVFATAAEFRSATQELAEEELRGTSVTWEFLGGLSPTDP